MADVIARRIALAGATFEANTHKSVNILSRNKTHKREKYQQTLQKKSERKKKAQKKLPFYQNGTNINLIIKSIMTAVQKKNPSRKIE